MGFTEENLKEELRGLDQNYPDFLQRMAHVFSKALPEEKVGQITAEVITSFMEEACYLPSAGTPQRKEYEALSRSLIRVGAMLDDWSKEGAENPYHNRAHNLLVMITSFVVNHHVHALFRKDACDCRPYSATHSFLMMRDLVTAIAHDMNHDGKENVRDGKYLPGFMEDASYDDVAVVLKKEGVSLKTQAFIKDTIFGSDPLLPGEIFESIKLEKAGVDISRISIQEQKEGLDSISLARVEAYEAQLREKNSPLFTSVALLKSADMMCSYGISRKMWLENTAAMNDEITSAGGQPIMKEGKPNHAGQLFVMFNFVGAEVTKSGDVKAQFPCKLPIFDEHFNDVLAQIQAECEEKAGPEASKLQKNIWRKKFEGISPK